MSATTGEQDLQRSGQSNSCNYGDNSNNSNNGFDNGNGGGNGNNGGQLNATGCGSAAQPQAAAQPQYTMPGILHYLQYKWQRFELERQQWEIERAELQARIALLQGERNGQENLKSDLVRRIKMLEYCLRQERAKYHKLQYGVDPPPLTTEADSTNEVTSEEVTNAGLATSDTSSVNWKQGRQLLRQYLQEIGYTDTIIDVRSNRVRSLLGLHGNTGGAGVNNSASVDEAGQGDSGSDANVKKTSSVTTITKCGRQQSAASNSKLPFGSFLDETEQSLLATFKFLNDHANTGTSGGKTAGAGASGSGDDDEDDNEMTDDVDCNFMDSETEEVLAEFDFLSAHQSGSGSTTTTTTTSTVTTNSLKSKEMTPTAGNQIKTVDMVDIGELAALTVNNDTYENGGSSNDFPDAALDVQYRKTWNPRYLLKSHFDCVRCLRFHPTESILVTCSEDETLKLWSLNKIQPASNKKQLITGCTTVDLEPVYTYRGHSARVLCLTLTATHIYSGAANGELAQWKIPANIASLDQYEPYDKSMLATFFDGHTDAVWSLVLMNKNQLLATASADQTIKIWCTEKHLCLKTIVCGAADTGLRATCVIAINSPVNPEENNQELGASFNDGSIAVFDLDTESFDKPVQVFERPSNCARINAIVAHPTMPVIISAHEDKQIRFWDHVTGKCFHEMVAHLDEVSCLDCDPHGLYLLSGSHDCSVRLWNFDTKTCIQEITSHRKKFDEAILDVSFHPTLKYFGSAGADGLAKVFV